jgi:hypothetical protein
MATTLPTGDNLGAVYVGANSSYTGSTITFKLQGSITQPNDLQIAAVSYEDMQASGTKLFDPTSIPFIDVESNIASPSSNVASGQISDSSVIVNGTINQNYKDWASKAWVNGDSLVVYVKESGDKSYTDCKVPNQTTPTDAMIQSSNTPVTVFVSADPVGGYNCQLVYSN